MTPEAQRIAIAKACGYKIKHCKYHNTETWHMPEGVCLEGNTEVCLPDYLNDLNAMHEAEKTLTQEQLKQTAELSLGFLAKDWCHRDYIYHTTARQRAEAFLKTLGLWEEDNPLEHMFGDPIGDLDKLGKEE